MAKKCCCEGQSGDLRQSASDACRDNPHLLCAKTLMIPFLLPDFQRQSKVQPDMRFFCIVLFLTSIAMVEPSAANDVSENIRHVILQIDHAVDTKDWEKAKKYFADEVRCDFESLSGQPAATITGQDLVDGWASNLGPKKTSFHQRGFGMVQVGEDGQTATAQSKGYAWNRMETEEIGGNGDPMWEVWALYTYTLKKQDGHWLVSGMKLDVATERGNPWVKQTPSP